MKYLFKILNGSTNTCKLNIGQYKKYHRANISLISLKRKIDKIIKFTAKFW